MQTKTRKTDWLVSALLTSAAISTVVAGTTAVALGKAGPTQSSATHTTVMPLSEGPHLVEVVGPALGGTEAMHYWKPSASELRQLEAHVPPSVASYYRQYIGVTSGKTRMILINGFSADVAHDYIGGKFDWHRSTVQVMDGGTGFFQATYDLHTHKFAGPHFNGVG